MGKLADPAKANIIIENAEKLNIRKRFLRNSLQPSQNPKNSMESGKEGSNFLPRPDGGVVVVVVSSGDSSEKLPASK